MTAKLTEKQRNKIIWEIKQLRMEKDKQALSLFPDVYEGTRNMVYTLLQDKLEVLSKDEASDIITMFVDGKSELALNQLTHLI